jgi:predicted oxidoreductase
MPSKAILREAQKLHNVSDCLDALAEEVPVVSDALVAIAGNVRHTATLLEVLVVTKLEGSGPANA